MTDSDQAANDKNDTAEDVRIRPLALIKRSVRLAGDSGPLWRALKLTLFASAERKYSLGAALQDAADENPDGPALLFEDRRWSYREFNAWANRYARALEKAGVGQGDRVAILMENRPETLAVISAVVKLGAVAGLLNTAQTGDVLAHSVGLIEPRATVVGTERIDVLGALVERDDVDVGTLIAQSEMGSVEQDGFLDLDTLADGMADSNLAVTATITMGDACFYVFTSGTTGLPKASIMSHYRWLSAMAGIGMASLRLTPADVLYCCLPLYHNNALTVSWGATIGSRSALALARKFSASKFWDDVRHHDATAFSYIGELCRYLIGRPRTDTDRQHAVRKMVGNGLRADIWDEFKQRFGIDEICEFYGASESNLGFINVFNQDRTVGFCPLPYAIVSCDTELGEPHRNRRGRLSKVASGATGLLLGKVTVRTPFDGYTDEAASEKKLLRDVFRRGDCWFNTGDLVRDVGYRHIQFVDRLGDTFRWKGENVATSEVEQILLGFPGVEECVVYGVTVPAADGRAGMAAITPESGVKAIDFHALFEFASARLPAYAVPQFVRIREAQVLTGTFKYRKVELVEQGFDPESTSEPVYRLDPIGKSFKQLSADNYREIVQNGLPRV